LAVSIGGETSASSTGGGNSVFGFALETASTALVITVGDSDVTGTSLISGCSSNTLLADQAISGSSGSGGLVDRWVFAVRNGGGASSDGLGASCSVRGSNACVNDEVHVVLAESRTSSPGGSAGVGTTVEFDIGGESCQSCSTYVACQRSSASFTRAPVEATGTLRRTVTAHAIVGNSASVGIGILIHRLDSNKSKDSLHKSSFNI